MGGQYEAKMKSLLGENTAFDAASPDVCASAIMDYLTTTTTTPAPTTTSTTTTPTPTTPTPPKAGAKEVVVAASYAAVETLPADVTASDLMDSDAYRSAKRDGLVSALNLPSDDAVTITGFVVAKAPARKQLRALSTASVSVTTEFTVAVPSPKAALVMKASVSKSAAAIKTATDTAMAAQDWSGEAVVPAL